MEFQLCFHAVYFPPFAGLLSRFVVALNIFTVIGSLGQEVIAGLDFSMLPV